MVGTFYPRHVGNLMAFAPSAVKVHSLRRVVYWHRGHRGTMLSHLLSWMDGLCMYELAYARNDRASCWRNYTLTCIRHPALFDGSPLYVAILIRRVWIISWIEFHYIQYLPIYVDTYSASGRVEPVLLAMCSHAVTLSDKVEDTARGALSNKFWNISRPLNRWA